MSYQKPGKLTRGVSDTRDLLNENASSDNKCSSYTVCDDSKSAGDSREQRVGLRGGRYKRYTLDDKLDARTIRQPSGCWEVQGHALHSGHVQISIGSPWNPPYIRVRAHVFAWERATGQKVPRGKVVMHSCDNPRCVNPAHLSVGTQHDNILDSIHKGRYNCFGIQKLNAEQVREIRALYATGRYTQKEIGERFGVAKNTVCGIINRRSWNHLDRPTDGVGDNVEPVPMPRMVQVPFRGDLHLAPPLELQIALVHSDSQVNTDAAAFVSEANR